MAKSRLYGWSGEMPEKEPTGQAQIVLKGLRAEPQAMRTGHEWAEIIGKEIATRQDPYRVVLYYILILKSKGCVRTAEPDIDAMTKRGDMKHTVTVKSQARVVVRHTDKAEETEEAAAGA